MAGKHGGNIEKMKLCPKCDTRWPAVCDFCRHYQFNGEPEERRGKIIQIYVDKGFCEFHQKRKDPGEGEGCDDFYCFKLEKK